MCEYLLWDLRRQTLFAPHDLIFFPKVYEFLAFFVVPLVHAFKLVSHCEYHFVETFRFLVHPRSIICTQFYSASSLVWRVVWSFSKNYWSRPILIRSHRCHLRYVPTNKDRKCVVCICFTDFASVRLRRDF